MSKKVNNTAAATVNAVFVNTIVQQLDVLSARRKEWEATDYKKANDGLYSLLSECLGIFNERFVLGSDEDKKALRLSLMQRLQADGIRIVKTSTTLTMLARYVFNSDRKRAQGYGYVLAAAVSHGVQTNDFSSWIVKQGGIEEVKRLMVKSEAARAKQAAVQAATAEVKGSIELNTLQPMAHVALDGFTGKHAVLLVKPNVKGGVDIVGSLDNINDSLVNALILRMAKDQVIKAEMEKELGSQIQKEEMDMLGANDVPPLKVANG
jgi:hypothetical protein